MDDLSNMFMWEQIKLYFIDFSKIILDKIIFFNKKKSIIIIGLYLMGSKLNKTNEKFKSSFFSL